MSNKTDRNEESETVKSRSQIKREMIQLQKIGERLVSLSSDQIKAISMPDNLMDAVLSAKKNQIPWGQKKTVPVYWIIDAES